MNWKRLLILIAAFILYLVIGALVFGALESSQEESTRNGTREYKEKFLAEFNCINEDKIEEFIEKIVKAINTGLDPRNNLTSKSNWDFSSAFFFSGTVVTTIGYGNISPSTGNGQAFCIMYALIGIPIFGFLLVAIGEKLKKNVDKLEARLNKRFVDHPKVKSAVYAAIIMLTGIVVFMLIPAAIFSRIEQWEFSDAFYYSFITLSTIGFGDFVIGTNQDIEYNIIYKWATYAWIIIGLAFLTLVISFISDIFTKTAVKLEEVGHNKMTNRQGGETEDGDEGKEEGKSEEVKTVWKESNGDSKEMKELQKENSPADSVVSV